MIYSLYYRNYLKACNYRCAYCPFPKVIPSAKLLEQDEKYVNKFVDFIKTSRHTFRIFFAPQGEALIYPYYQKALVDLSKLKNVKEIVMQTNLSCNLAWLTDVEPDKLVLWATYHPGEVGATIFFDQLKALLGYPIRFTIGAVGVRDNFAKLREMKQLVDQLGVHKPYMWINAYKAQKNYYHAEDLNFLKECDPLFVLNLTDYKSQGLACKTGANVFFVEWNGNIHRCWQVKAKLGNLYADDLAVIHVDSNCEKAKCGCFIGYSHLKTLNLDQVYKTSLLGRIP